MATNYPAALDDTTVLPNTRTDNTTSAGNHAQDHDNLSDAVRAIETELGTLPKGASGDVKTRLNGVDTSLAAKAATTYVDSSVASEATTRSNADALLAPKASPALTGTPTVPTAAPSTNTTQAASTAYADAAVAVEASARSGADALLAPLASPALTGNPTVPTQVPGTNSTRTASTAYADAAVAVETSARTTADGLLVPKSLVTAKGDLIAATASGAVTNKAVGADGLTLLADAASAGGIAWTQLFPQPKSGDYVCPPLSQPGTVGGNSGFFVAVPVLVPKAVTLDRLSINCTIAAAASSVRLGIYSGASRPTTLILEAGTVATTATGVKEIVISQALSPGLYWFVAQCEGGNPSMIGNQNTAATPFMVTTTAGATSMNGWQYSHTGTLAADLSAVTFTEQTSATAVYGRVV